MLDEFNKLVEPVIPGVKLDSAASEFADHLVCLIEGKNKPITALSGTTQVTYSDLKKIFDRILSSSYWTQQPEQKVELTTESTTTTTTESTPQQVETKQETEQSTNLEQPEANLVSAVENLELNKHNEQQQFVQQQLDQGSKKNYSKKKFIK